MSNEIEAGTNVYLTLHREPEGASDKFAHGVVKFLRFFCRQVLCKPLWQSCRRA
jgi:hypothetical protein